MPSFIEKGEQVLWLRSGVIMASSRPNHNSKSSGATSLCVVV